MKFNPVKMLPLSLVDACIEELSTRMNTEEAKPMSQTALDLLRLDGKKPPPTLLRYLAYDCTFYAMCNDWGMFDHTGPIGASTPNEWEPIDLDVEIQHMIEDLAWKPVEELTLVSGRPEAGWVDPVSSPRGYLQLELSGKMFKLPNVGNQTHYMYVGMPDSHGEYPILGAEMKGDMENDTTFWGQLNLWVKYPNFAVYLYDQIFDADVYPDDFVIQMDEIYKNNPDLSLNYKNTLGLFL